MALFGYTTELTWPTGPRITVNRWAVLPEKLAGFIPMVKRIMLDDNRQGLLAGQDRHGRPLKALATSTLLRRHFSLNTKPLVPHGMSSRAIAGYRVNSQQVDGGYLVIGSWPGVLSTKGTPFLQFHIEGAGTNPQRDIAGLRPAGQARLQLELHNWLYQYKNK